MASLQAVIDNNNSSTPLTIDWDGGHSSLNGSGNTSGADLGTPDKKMMYKWADSGGSANGIPSHGWSYNTAGKDTSTNWFTTGVIFQNVANNRPWY